LKNRSTFLQAFSNSSIKPSKVKMEPEEEVIITLPRKVTNACLAPDFPGGDMTEPGQPLNRLVIPAIATLISGTRTISPALATIALTLGSDELFRPGVEGEIQVGTEINLSVFGKNRFGQINPAEIPMPGSGRRIPKNRAEARDDRHLIVSSRAGAKNTAFRVSELKQIARNLGLSLNGNKDELVNRIQTEIKNYYQLQE
jgi:hypothetical protein